MTIEPPTKSIANGDDLTSDDDALTAVSPEPSNSTTTTTPSPSSQLADDELKRVRLQVLDFVEAEENRQEEEAQQMNHEKEQVLYHQGSDIGNPCVVGTSAGTSSISFETSSSVVAVPPPPGLVRNLHPPRPSYNPFMTARPVPQEYRREHKQGGVDPNHPHYNSQVVVGGPGAYPMRPTTHPDGMQDQNTSYGDTNDDEGMTRTTIDDGRHETLLLLSSEDDPETAVEAQVVPERDLNDEVQQRMKAITIDPLTVEVRTKERAAQPPRDGAVPKSVIRMMIALCLMALVAIGSAVGIKTRKKRLNNTSNSVYVDSGPTSPPMIVSAMERARAIVSHLSGNETLWDVSTPQYQALWWIVHEDPAKMMMNNHDETQASYSMIVERYVMAVLYFSTNGPNGLEQENFLGNTSICVTGASKLTTVCNAMTSDQRRSYSWVSLLNYILPPMDAATLTGKES
jgi:hypothetical protein